MHLTASAPAINKTYRSSHVNHCKGALVLRKSDTELQTLSAMTTSFRRFHRARAKNPVSRREEESQGITRYLKENLGLVSYSDEANKANNYEPLESGSRPCQGALPGMFGRTQHLSRARNRQGPFAGAHDLGSEHTLIKNIFLGRM